jgi:NADH:flavin oxidoreductase / NADH oxidase family
MGDDDPEASFGHIAEKTQRGRARLSAHCQPAVAAIEKGIEPDPGALGILELIREKYRGTLIIAGGFDHDTAEGWLRHGKAELIAFRRKFLANPDLPERFRSRASPKRPRLVFGREYSVSPRRGRLPYWASTRAARSAARGSEKCRPTMALKRGAADKEIETVTLGVAGDDSRGAAENFDDICVGHESFLPLA